MKKELKKVKDGECQQHCDEKSNNDKKEKEEELPPLVVKRNSQKERKKEQGPNSNNYCPAAKETFALCVLCCEQNWLAP